MYKILIVDNDTAIRLFYRLELEDEGYVVTTATGYTNLPALVKRLRPDLVLLEVALGRINGLDILQDIRKTYYDMPVIICSAYDCFRYDLKATAADYYVIKSFDTTELKTKIKMALASIT